MMPATTSPAPVQPQSESSTLTLEMLLHDLSAPVRHIGFFVGELVKSLPDLTPQQAEIFHRIEENLATERTLLQDSRLLLSYERHPVIVWERPVHVNALLEEIASSFRPDFEKRGLTLRLDLPDDTEILVDPKALSRVISNLLGNALKATPPGGIVIIGARLQAGQMMFSVSDTGGGFTAKQAAGVSRAWADFDLGINPPEVWGGLGLLICHSIVAKYGGHLILVSDGLGRGSTFSFGIRVARGDQAA